MSKIELLAPAGDLLRAKTAIRYGADAVYLGGKRFSLRSRASNFDIPDIAEAVAFATLHNAKIFVTVNIIPHDEDLDGLADYVSELERIGVSALIVASAYIASVCRKTAKKMEVHLSTQQSITNSAAVEFYKKLGIDRVVLARETSMEDIRSIVSTCQLPIEVFIHGGMCVNYSGRCTLSNEMTLRDANRGGCAQSCRWKYRLYDQGVEISDPDVLFSMSSKDLNAVRYVAELIEAGVTSLKIEGRMKSAYYIACVVDAYRKLIDAYETYGSISDELIRSTEKSLKLAENRATADGFYRHVPKSSHHLYSINGSGITQDFLGSVKQVNTDGSVFVEVRNNFKTGQLLEVFSPLKEIRQFTVGTIINSQDSEISVANKPMEWVRIAIPFTVEVDDFIRRKGV